MDRYIIIGRSTCSYCVDAMRLLKQENVDFVFLDYAERPEILDDYKQFHNMETVPIILKNNLTTGYVSLVGGYTSLAAQLSS